VLGIIPQWYICGGGRVSFKILKNKLMKKWAKVGKYKSMIH